MLDISQFQLRRQRLLAQLQPNSVCVIPAALELTRSRDTEFPFRQDSDFYYLCGFPEPQAWLLLTNHPRYGGQHTALVCRDKNPTAEIWHGRRIGAQAARSAFGLDAAFELDQLDEVLAEYLDEQQHLYFAQGHNDEADHQVFAILAQLRAAPKQSKSPPTSLIDVRPLVHEMRLFKSDYELELMGRAAEISVAAHKRAMTVAKPGCYEYQLEAELQHQFAMQGARYPAYSTIVGSGDNACILHYTENSDEITDGDLVLIDAGCEYAGYAADITRTFPVNGRFTEPQRQLYQLVLDAQLAAMTLLKPGNTLKQATDLCIQVLTEGLLELGLLQGELNQNIEDKSWHQFFMHGLGHWLGLDVHDVGMYKIDQQDRPLAPGMVLTVEPGLYIAADAKVEQKWRGIGIRIEDNIVITAQGHINLTAAMPKSVADIEQLMAEGRGH